MLMGQSVRQDLHDAATSLAGQPLSRQIKLLASDPAKQDAFGSAVALSRDGSTAIIGSPGKNNAQGTVYVFTRSGENWTQQAEITASDGAFVDYFGASVALSNDGNTALVGAWGKDHFLGAAYVFTRSGTNWSQQTRLAFNTSNVNIGKVLALSGDGRTAFVTAYQSIYPVAVYVFTRTSTGWMIQEAPLALSNSRLPDAFGSSLALSEDGNTAVIGAPGTTALLQPGVYITTGAVYIFVRSNGIWIQQAGLNIPPNGRSADDYGTADFGSTVALSADGNTALVGAPGATQNFSRTGKAHVFTRSGTIWTWQADLIQSDAQFQGHFGNVVSISADGATALVGATGKRAAYLFSKTAAGWASAATLTASDGAPLDSFGFAGVLAADASTALIGTPNKPADGVSGVGELLQGAAYLYTSAVAGVPINVTLLSSPSGLRLTAGTITANAPYLFTDMPGTSLPIDAPSPQPGGPGYRFVFQSWNHGGTQKQTQIVPSVDISYTAQYQVQAQLALTSSPPIGGSVVPTPTSSDGFYNLGQSVSLAAIPAGGYIFTGFSGASTGTSSPAAILMSSPRSVTANFAPAQAPSLTAVVQNDLSRTAQPGPVVTAQIAFQNTGTGIAILTITSLIARVLSPTGLTATIVSRTPITIEGVPANGTSRTVSVELSVPADAQRTLVSGFATSDRGLFSFSFTVIRPPVTPTTPSVTSVTPVSARRGQTMRISGLNFDPVCSNNTVTIGATSGHPTPPCSNTVLSFAIPYAAASGNLNLQVINTLGRSNTRPFTVVPTQLIVAANQISNQISVMNFSDPTMPVVTTLRPDFGSGAYVVDINGSTMAVADALGPQVALYDVRNPEAPVKLAIVNTSRSSIGAIKLNEKYLLVGDAHGTQVVLIDVSNPASPQIVSTVSSLILPVGSIGFSNNRAVVSGPNSPLIGIIDYSDAVHPVATTVAPRVGSALVADLDGAFAALGSVDGPQVSLVDVTMASVTSRVNTLICSFTLPPGCVGSPDQCASPTCYSSISMNGMKVAVASDTHRDVGLVDFSDLSNPTVSQFDPQLGVAAPIIAFNGDYLAAGGTNPAAATSFVSLFRIAGSTATRLGMVNSRLPNIQALAMSIF